MIREPFIWRDKEHWVFPELRSTVEAIETTEDAEEFFTAYSEVCAHAEESIGYIATTFPVEVKDDILDLFMVDEHVTPTPVFNNSSMGVKVET